MPSRTIAPVGAPCWIDLLTSDVAQATAFYTGLFGWTAEEPDQRFGGYVNFRQDDVRVAGCMSQHPGSRMPDCWSVYLATDDVDATVAATLANGGGVIVPAVSVDDLGRMAVVTDPSGAAIGMWQPGTHPGFGVHHETGAPVWFELHTRDYASAVPFYRDVFRWDGSVLSDTDEFRMTTISDDGAPVAGIIDASGHLPDGVPSYWGAYFGVDDTDKALADVAALGGSVLRPGADTPYGRIGTAADPTGATFSIVQPLGI